MRKTKRKIFLAWNFEKEEAWINKMEDKGLHLVDVGMWTFVFEEGEAGLYDYRVELGAVPADSVWGREYATVQNDAGIEYIASFQRKIYWRKKKSPEGFDLFSDRDSSIAYLKRVLKYVGSLSALFTFILVANFLNGISEHEVISRLDIGIWIVLLVISLLGIGQCLKIYRKIRSLKKERVLFE